MANIQSISHKKSAVVENGAPKLPTISQLELGELAINFADGYETLSIKNNNDEIVTFTNDQYWKDKELVIAAALNDLKQNKQDILVYDEVPTENSENPVTSGGLYNYITEIEQGTAAALNDLNGRIQTEDTPTQGSTKLVTSGGLYTYITDIEEVVSEALNDLNDRKQDILDIDNTPTQYSNNPISSNAAFEMSKVTAAALNDLNQRKANTSDVQQMIEDYGLSSLAPVATSGSYNDLTDTPNISVTQIATTGTQIANVMGTTLYAPNATVTQVLNTGTEIAQVGSTSIYAPDNTIYEVNHGTSDTVFTLTPNTMHIWGEVASLDLSLPQDTNTALDEYLFTFTCPAAAPTTLILPADVKWVQQPNLQEGKTYQVSIMNGLAGYLTDDMETSGDENIIEEIKLNGTALPITDKSVNINTVTSITVNSNNYTPDATGLVDLGTIGGGTETDPIFSASPAAGITAANITDWNSKVSNVQADWNATSGLAQILNKPTIPAAVTESTVSGWGFTKNTGTITGITMNGTSKGTSGVIDLGTVLTSHQDISGKADKSAAIGSLSLSMDSTNYKITLSGTKVDGTTFTVADVIDLPLESVVVSGTYNNTTKKVVLTLKDGSTVDFSVADLVNGLQTEITSTNKLSADLIADGTTNKVVTAAEKTAWNNKSNFSGNYNDLTNKPTIPAAPGILNTNNTTAQTVSASESLSGTIKLHKVAKTGNYNDLLNKPTIPTALADLTADATHRLVTDTEKSSWNNAGNIYYTDGSWIKDSSNNTLSDYSVITQLDRIIDQNNNIYYCVGVNSNNLIFRTVDEEGAPSAGYEIDVNNNEVLTLSSIAYLTSSDIPTLSKGTTTGSGNAVTDISVSGHTITLTKGSTFLTSVTGDDITYGDPNASEVFIGKGDTINECLTNLDNAIVTKANGADVVHKTRTETISGDKTFRSVTTTFDSNDDRRGTLTIKSSPLYDTEINMYYEGQNYGSSVNKFDWITFTDGGGTTTTLTAFVNRMESPSNKVTSISSSSTNTQYPSALAVYNFGTNLVGQLTKIYSGSGAPASSLGNNGDIYIKVT